MQLGKHTRLPLETMRVCRLAPATAGEDLHTLANSFFGIFRKFPAWGWDSLSNLYRNSPYFNLDELDESHVENIQDNPVNLFKLAVDGQDEKTEDIVLQDIHERKNKMLKRQHSEYFWSMLNNIRSMSCSIEDDENVMKEASKKLKSLKNFVEESLPREMEYRS